ncbi:MAG: SGNH/GDSL hydrolase family protein [Clostridiales bacterium]|nr:SGNH/GDSL hydrolase family protein [Candidatus Equinaster intestinalis]
MKIEELDKNMAMAKVGEEDDVVWYDVRKAPFKLYGLYNAQTDSYFHRLPENVYKECSERLREIEKHTAGGRIRFKTDSPFVAVKVFTPWQAQMTNMSLSGSSSFDIFVYENEAYRFLNCFRPPFLCENGEWNARSNVPKGLNEYLLPFPLYNAVEKVYVGIQKGSVLKECDGYKHENPVVFYGSSITQGASASRPGTCYEELISHRFDLNYINLGFSGAALGEQAIAEYIGTLEMSAFVLDFDHNHYAPEPLRKTHLPFYKTFRKLKPDTPLIMVSRPYPIMPELREIIKDTYKYAIEQGDKNVAFIDGETLFAGDHYTECTVDGCHPNDIGHYRMSQVIGNEIKKMLNL